MTSQPSGVNVSGDARVLHEDKSLACAAAEQLLPGDPSPVLIPAVEKTILSCRRAGLPLHASAHEPSRLPAGWPRCARRRRAQQV